MSGDLALLPRRSLSTRAYLIALVTALLLVALAFAGVLLVHFARTDETRVMQQLGQTSRDITRAIDREITATIGILKVLATSHYLQSGDLEGFHRQASDLARQLDVQIVLRDPFRKMPLVDTALPWGAPLPAGSDVVAAQEENTLRTGRPTVSNLFFGPLARRHMVAVMVPVVRDGKTVQVLAVCLPAAAIAEILDRAQVQPGWLVAVVDGNRTMVARSEKHDEFVGKPVPRIALGPLGDSGPLRGPNFEGITFRWIYQRSDVTGWRVSTGVAEREITGTSTVALGSLLAVGLGLLGVGVVVANRFGRRVAGDAGRLRSAVAAMRRHEAVPSVETSLPEMSEVSQTLSTASAELRASEERRRFAVEAAEVGTWSTDLETGERVWSDRTRDLVGLAAGVPVSRDALLDRVHPADRARVAQQMQSCIEAGLRFDIEYRVIDARDGAVRWVESKGQVERDTDGHAIRLHGIVQDVTARKGAEEERDELRRRLLGANEAERLRLAQELHDETGQGLAAVMLDLKAIEPLVADHGRERLHRLRGQLEGMGRALHRVAWELRPASIDDLGLTKTLAHYVADWAERTGIDADFHCRDPELDRVTEDVRTTLYRVLQEALTNVAKHATSATGVSVVVDRAHGQLQMTIEDDGCGFDADELQMPTRERPGRGLGLAGMRERLSLVDGELEIESSAGVGTTVFARIRLNAEEQAP